MSEDNLTFVCVSCKTSLVGDINSFKDTKDAKCCENPNYKVELLDNNGNKRLISVGKYLSYKNNKLIKKDEKGKEVLDIFEDKKDRVKEVSERIKKLLEQGKLWDEIVFTGLNKRIIEHIELREVVFCFILGRLVKNSKPASLNLLVKGDSGSGKDWVVKNVGDLFPEQDIEYFGRATSKAFNYVNDSKENPNYNYDGKVVYLEEITEKTLNDEVMKVWTSGKNRMVSVERGKSIIKEPKGKPVIIATSFSAIPSIEILNRFGILYAKTSPDMKKRVMCQRLKVATEGLEDNYDPEILNFLALLKPFKIKIPFAEKLGKHIDAEKLQGESRVIDRILDIIKSVAIFNQFLKEPDKESFLVADEKDYEIARGVIKNITVGFPDFLLDEKQKEILEILNNEKEPLSAEDILTKVRSFIISIQGFRPHLQRLVDLKKIEAIPLLNERHYNINKYQVLETKKEYHIKLPPFDEL